MHFSYPCDLEPLKPQSCTHSISVLTRADPSIALCWLLRAQAGGCVTNTVRLETSWFRTAMQIIAAGLFKRATAHQLYIKRPGCQSAPPRVGLMDSWVSGSRSQCPAEYSFIDLIGSSCVTVTCHFQVIAYKVWNITVHASSSCVMWSTSLQVSLFLSLDVQKHQRREKKKVL